MIDHDHVRHGWGWLKGPVSGLVGTGVLSWLGSLELGQLLATIGAAAPVAIGTVIGGLERWDIYRHRKWLRAEERKAYHKQYRATPGDRIDPAKFRPEPDEPK